MTVIVIMIGVMVIMIVIGVMVVVVVIMLGHHTRLIFSYIDFE